MGGLGVRVLHISDLHMRTIDGPQAGRARLEAASRWRVMGEQWVANLAELRRGGVPFDLVVFTGDLGDRGHATDYPPAMAFLKQTCATLNVPLDRLFVVPGNHRGAAERRPRTWSGTRHVPGVVASCSEAPPKKRSTEGAKAAEACQEEGRMRFHFATVPVHGSVAVERESNVFLSSRRVPPCHRSERSGCRAGALAVERHLVADGAQRSGPMLHLAEEVR